MKNLYDFFLGYEVYELNHQCHTNYTSTGIPLKSKAFKFSHENPSQKCADLCKKTIFWLQKRVDGNTCICYNDTEKGECEIYNTAEPGTLCRPVQIVRKRINGESCKHNSECKSDHCNEETCKAKKTVPLCVDPCSSTAAWRGK